MPSGSCGQSAGYLSATIAKDRRPGQQKGEAAEQVRALRKLRAKSRPMMPSGMEVVMVSWMDWRTARMRSQRSLKPRHSPVMLCRCSPDSSSPSATCHIGHASWLIALSEAL